MKINAINRTLLFIIAIALLACGCTRQQPSDPRLQRLTLSVDTGPQAVIDSLAAIDPATLGEFDRHYYNFLTVKARDKAYIVHTSDSLILNVINHFGRSPKMAEALYYAGRVYSDLGDYPTALRYFHDALDRISDDPEEDELRGRVLSQTGRMLSNCGLHRQSLPYLKECLELSISRNDTVNTTYDYQLLGSIYLDLQEYDTATIYLDKAYSLAKHLSDADLAFMEGFLAIAFYQQNKIDSALIMIRNVPERIFDDDKDFFLVYASNIYFKAEKFDTAYMYAKQAINSPKSDFQISAYCALLNPELRKYSSPDTIFEYLERYRMAIRQMHRQIDEKSITVQNAQYNYAVHEREAQRQSEVNTSLKGWLISITIIILILTIAVLYLKQRNSRYIIRLQTSLQELERLNARIAAEEANATEAIPYLPTTVDIADIPQQISNELAIIEARTDKNPTLPESVTGSKAFQDLQQMMQQGQPLKTECKLWQDLRQTVTEAFPEFQNTLYRMSGGTIKKDDMDLAILIKLGATPIQLAKLLCKSPGTITYRRRQLLAKLAPEQESISSLDPLIRHI